MRLRLLSPTLVLVVLVAGTATAAIVVHRSDVSHARDRQKELVAETQAALGSVTDGTVGRLVGLAGALGIAPHLGPREYATVARPMLSDRALTSISYVARVPRLQRRAYEREHGLRIVETRLGGRRVPAAPATFYAVVEHAAQRDPGPSSIGANAAVDPERRATMLAAAMAGRPQLTPPSRSRRPASRA